MMEPGCWAKALSPFRWFQRTWELHSSDWTHLCHKLMKAVHSILLKAGCAHWMVMTLLAQAQPGSLDLSFDPGAGVVASAPGYSSVSDLAVQSDGKIVVVGSFTNLDG